MTACLSPRAIEFAFTYANTHLIPLLTRIWPVPNDLPHAAGMGDLVRVKQWFDKAGAPALGDLNNHYPYNDRGIDMTIKDYRWNSTAQGWALHALKDEALAQWLDDAERKPAK